MEGRALEGRALHIGETLSALSPRTMSKLLTVMGLTLGGERLLMHEQERTRKGFWKDAQFWSKMALEA